MGVVLEEAARVTKLTMKTVPQLKLRGKEVV